MFSVLDNDADATTTITATFGSKSITKNEGSGVEHFFDKLLHIKSLIFTAKGKEIANERHAFMLLYLKQLGIELSEPEAVYSTPMFADTAASSEDYLELATPVDEVVQEAAAKVDGTDSAAAEADKKRTKRVESILTEYSNAYKDGAIMTDRLFLAGSRNILARLKEHELSPAELPLYFKKLD